jgi:hypothetical protein
MEKPPESRDNDFAIAGKGWVEGCKQLGFDDYKQSKAYKRINCQEFFGWNGEVCAKLLIHLAENESWIMTSD